MLHKMLLWKEVRANALIMVLGIGIAVVVAFVMLQFFARDTQLLMLLNYWAVYPFFALLVGASAL